jgi:hypothetical protein
MRPVRPLIAGLVASAIVQSSPEAAALSKSALDEQRAQVEQALRPLIATLKTQEAALDSTADGRARDEQLDTLITGHRVAELRVLEPLATNGNAEAMYRMADLLRDGSSIADVRRWYSLETEAAKLGHPGADDELVRWYWHQRGDGSIAQVQRNRETALSYAEKAADDGSFNAISRIGVYVSGNVHQYPGDVSLVGAH